MDQNQLEKHPLHSWEIKPNFRQKKIQPLPIAGLILQRFLVDRAHKSSVPVFDTDLGFWPSQQHSLQRSTRSNLRL